MHYWTLSLSNNSTLHSNAASNHRPFHLQFPGCSLDRMDSKRKTTSAKLSPSFVQQAWMTRRMLDGQQADFLAADYIECAV